MWVIYISIEQDRIYSTDPEWNNIYYKWLSMSKETMSWKYAKEWIER